MARMNRITSGCLIRHVFQGFSTQVVMTATCYMKAGCSARNLVSHTLSYCLCAEFLCFVRFINCSFVRSPFLSTFCLLYKMADEIQPVTVGIRGSIAMETAIRNRVEEGGELVLHSGCQGWTVDKHKAD